MDGDTDATADRNEKRGKPIDSTNGEKRCKPNEALRQNHDASTQNESLKELNYGSSIAKRFSEVPVNLTR